MHLSVELSNEINQLKEQNNNIRISLSEKTQENNELNNSITRLKGEVDSNKIKLEKYQAEEDSTKNKNNVEFLNGKWNVKIKNDISRKIEEFVVNIHKGKVYRKNSENISKEWFTITKYNRNEVTENLEIETSIIINNQPFNLTFSYNNDYTKLIGEDNINVNNKYFFNRNETLEVLL